MVCSGACASNDSLLLYPEILPKNLKVLVYDTVVVRMHFKLMTCLPFGCACMYILPIQQSCETLMSDELDVFFYIFFRELKRLSTVTLSPIYAHFQETIMGLTTIRAMRANDRFMRENEKRLEMNQRANYASKS